MSRNVILLGCALLLAIGCNEQKPKQIEASSASSTPKGNSASSTTDPSSKSSTTETPNAVPVVSQTLVPNAAVKPLIKAKQKDPKALLAAAVAHKGGLEALQGVKSVTSESKHLGVLERRAKVWIIYPDKIRVDYYDGETLEKSLIINGTAGHQLTKGSIVDLSVNIVADVKKATLGEVMPLLIRASKEDAVLTYLGETEVAGNKADAVRVKLPTLGEIIFFVAADSGAFIGEQIPLGMGLQTVIESDYKMVDGINIAHKTKVLIGGQVVVSTIESVTINPPLTSDIFEPMKHPLNQ